MDNDRSIQNASIKQIKKKVRTFRNNFKKTHGRNPSQNDIKARPNIFNLYRQLQSILKPSQGKSTDKASITNTMVKNLENIENNNTKWVRRQDLEKTKIDEKNDSKNKQQAWNKKKKSKACDFDGNFLRRVSGSVAREFMNNKKRKGHGEDTSSTTSYKSAFPISKTIMSLKNDVLNTTTTMTNNNNNQYSHNINIGSDINSNSKNNKRLKLIDNDRSFQIKRINEKGRRGNLNQNNLNGRLNGVGRFNVNKDATMRREHCLILPVKTTMNIPEMIQPIEKTNDKFNPSSTKNTAGGNATFSLEINNDNTVMAPEQIILSLKHSNVVGSLHLQSQRPGVPLSKAIPKNKETKSNAAKRDKSLNSTITNTTTTTASSSITALTKAAALKKKPSNQISENYVRIDLRKRWRGKKKLGSGKYRAHKEFMRKRATNDENKDEDTKPSRHLNSGRDIIDNLLELSEKTQKTQGDDDSDNDNNVPKCPGHGYPCIVKTVKKSGKNKGRKFYVCPLDRKQQCRCFFWVDDSVEIAMQEFNGSDSKEEQLAKRIASEKRKLLQLTVKELKIRLSRRNLSCQGKKEDLVNRLAVSISEVMPMATSASFTTNVITNKTTEEPNSVDSASSGDEYGDDSDVDSDDSLEFIDMVSPPPLSNSSVTVKNNNNDNNFNARKNESFDRRKLHTLLEEKYGFKAYRKGQLWGIERTLKGQSSLVVLPTGGGKSLIYQIAAMMAGGLTLVVSPLLSLMRDQLEHLPHGLHGGALNSTMGKVEIARVLRDLRERTLKILFVSPERLFSASFQRLWAKPGLMPPISIAVIDEAHCISEWSHNFRSSYMRLNQVLRGSNDISLNAKCVLALTATATPPVVNHIATSLQLPADGILIESWKRSNLILNVEQDTAKHQALNKLLKSNTFVKPKKKSSTNRKSLSNNRFKGFRESQTLLSIIVYVFRQYDANNVAQFLKQQGFSAAAYHAGMSWNDREKVQSAFISGKTKIMVATVAFGMGLDKADVRGVIHFHIPKSIESYVQEVGRAGRDGKESHCYLLLNDTDFIKNHSLAHADSIDRIQVIKLLKLIFERYTENNNGKNNRSLNTKRRMVSIVQNDISKQIDMKTNVMETLLCHLTLPPHNLLELLPNACITCVVTCKFSIEKIKKDSSNCRKIFDLGKLKTTVVDQRNGYCKGNSVYEINVPDIAYTTNIPEIEIRRVLDDLRYRNFITTSWKHLSFRCIPRENVELSPDAYDTLCDFLWKKTSSFEKSLRTKAETMYVVAKNNLSNDIISKYFDGDAKELLNLFRENEESVPFDEPKVPLLRADVHVLMRDQRLKQKKVLATPRAITRIFHGIASPAFPYSDFKDSVFWNRHLSIEFNVLLGHVKDIVTKLKSV
jgi:ATP-dependent DNA helicase Q4